MPRELLRECPRLGNKDARVQMGQGLSLRQVPVVQRQVDCHQQTSPCKAWLFVVENNDRLLLCFPISVVCVESWYAEHVPGSFWTSVMHRHPKGAECVMDASTDSAPWRAREERSEKGRRERYVCKCEYCKSNGADSYVM